MQKCVEKGCRSNIEGKDNHRCAKCSKRYYLPAWSRNLTNVAKQSKIEVEAN